MRARATLPPPLPVTSTISLVTFESLKAWNEINAEPSQSHAHEECLKMRGERY